MGMGIRVPLMEGKGRMILMGRRRVGGFQGDDFGGGEKAT